MLSCSNKAENVKDEFFMAGVRVYIDDNNAGSEYSIPAVIYKWWRIIFIEDRCHYDELKYSKVNSEDDATVFFRHDMEDDIKYTWDALKMG